MIAVLARGQRRRRQGVGRASTSCSPSSTSSPSCCWCSSARPRPLARDAGRQRRPRRRPDLEELPAGDPDRDDRLHRHRDDLEHGRGGQGRATTIPAAINRVRIAVFAIYFTLPAVALSALPVDRDRQRRVPDPARPQPRTRAASPATRSSASSSRSTSGRSRAPASSTSACSPRRSSSSPRTPADRRLAARLLDGHPPPGARRAAPAAPALPHAVDRDPRLRRRRVLTLLPGQADFLGYMYAFGAMLSFTIAHVGGDPAARTHPDATRPYRGPGTCACAATTCRCSPSSAGLGPRSRSS